MTRGLLGTGTALLLFAVSLGVAAGCGGDSSGEVDGFSKAEWAIIDKLSPLPEKPAVDSTSRFADSAQAATLGQMLFMDKSFSGPLVVDDNGHNGALGMAGQRERVACVSCHDPGHYMIDTHSKPNNTAIGANYMIRNASTALNSSYYKVWCENDGIRDRQASDALTDPEDPTSMNGSRLLVAHVLYKKYKAEYNALFDEKLDDDLDPKSKDADRFPPEGKPGDGVKPSYDTMTKADKLIIDTIFSNFGKAIQAYVRLLVSRNATFDKYVAGDHSAISAEAKLGLELFLDKANCISCHSGPLFSESKFHDTGLDNEGTHVIHTETGRFDGVGIVLADQFNSNSVFSDDQHSGRLDGLVAKPADKGAWRTKQLRNIAMTAPYMHTGQFETLTDVLKFYNAGGSKSGYIGTKDKLMKPLNLTDEEIANLIEFLNTLTGDPLPSNLAKNTSK